MAQRDMHAYNVETLYAVLELNQEKKIKNWFCHGMVAA